MDLSEVIFHAYSGIMSGLVPQQTQPLTYSRQNHCKYPDSKPTKSASMIKKSTNNITISRFMPSRVSQVMKSEKQNVCSRMCLLVLLRKEGGLFSSPTHDFVTRCNRN